MTIPDDPIKKTINNSLACILIATAGYYCYDVDCHATSTEGFVLHFRVQSVEDALGLYELFNNGDLGSLLAHYAEDAEVHNPTLGTTGHGHEGLATQLAFWPVHFQGARVDLSSRRGVEMSADELAAHSQAASGYVITFNGLGRHVKEFKLADDTVVAPKSPEAEIELPLTEKIWVNAAGKIIYQEVSFNPDSLR